MRKPQGFTSGSGCSPRLLVRPHGAGYGEAVSWFFILGALFGSIAIFQLGEVALKLGRIARALERIADELVKKP